MGLETATYLVSEDIARRSGLIGSRYRVADGRYVLNDRDLSRVRFTADEFVNGLPGVVKISSLEARTLIRESGFSFGVNQTIKEKEE